MSPLPWSISDSHGLCVVDADRNIVADLTPRSDWATTPEADTLRANAEAIVSAAQVLATPDGWARIGGELVRLVEFDVVADDGETLTCWAKEG